jgi:hypothetical protein
VVVRPASDTIGKSSLNSKGTRPKVYCFEKVHVSCDACVFLQFASLNSQLHMFKNEIALHPLLFAIIVACVQNELAMLQTQGSC